MVFEGTPGSFYQFKLQARDYANNLESEHASVDAEISLLTGISRISSQKLLVYPNPASGIVHLQFAEELRNAEIQIVDVYGRIVQSISGVSGAFVDADISNLAQGLYTIVCFDRGSRYAKKLQKQ